MADSELSTKQQIESIWKLGGLNTRELARRVWHVVYEGNLTGSASELAYNFIFSVFPPCFFCWVFSVFLPARGANCRPGSCFTFLRYCRPTHFMCFSTRWERLRPIAVEGNSPLEFCSRSGL